MKPLSVCCNSGSSRKKASWPLSVWISAKLARQPAPFSARTMSRLSIVG